MINFKELDKSGVEFEQLIRELLISEGFEVHWTGVGPDGDKDLVVIESGNGGLSNLQKKWVVQCKHKAHGGRSVGKNELSIVSTCNAINADGFLLACSTQPSAGLINHFEEIERNNNIQVLYWDSIEIEKRLMKPNNYNLASVFFKESSRTLGWKLMNTYDSKFWMAYFQRYFIYLSSRDSLTFTELSFVEKLLGIMEGFNKIDKRELLGSDSFLNFTEYLMPRAVHYDDKNTVFTVFLDYIFHRDEKPKARKVDFDDYFNVKNNIVDGVSIEWDVKFIETSFYSDHFQVNHKDYYKDHIDNFKQGYSRDCSLSSTSFYDFHPYEKLIHEFKASGLIKNYIGELSLEYYGKTIVEYLKGKPGGSDNILNILEIIRVNEDFSKEKERENLWQIQCMVSIDDLVEKGFVEPKDNAPNGVISLSSKGKELCRYYDRFQEYREEFIANHTDGGIIKIGY